MSGTQASFNPKDTKQENIAAAHDWLGKALKMEEEGKGKGIIDRALDRACLYESAAFA